MFEATRDTRKCHSAGRVLALGLLLFLPGGWASAAQEDRSALLVSDLKDKDWQVRRAAALSLGELAVKNKKLITSLMAVLEDEDSRVRRSGAEALGVIGPKAKAAIPRLLRLLRDEDATVRQSAAEALGRIGPKARTAVHTLIGMLQEGDPRVRRSAAEGLGGIGEKAKAAVPSLTHALEDGHAEVREAAAKALGMIGAKRGIPALIEMLEDEDATVRDSAAWALERIGKPAISPLVRALRSDNPIFLHQVVTVLGRGGERAASELVEVLKDSRQNLMVRRSAAVALAKIGSDVKKVVPALIEALEDEDPRVRRAAASALGKIGPGAADSLPRLMEKLKDQDEDPVVRQYAAAAVARVGPNAAEVDSALVEALGDENPSVHRAAVKALAEIIPGESKAGESDMIPALVRRLETGDAAERQSALRQFGMIGRPAVPALTSVMETGDAEARQYAAMALARIGPDARGAVPKLIEVMAETKQAAEVRRLAATALGMIGPKARAGIPALLRTLKDEQEELELRGSAATALGMIGPEASQALPALIALLKNDDTRIRGLALAAIERIGPPPRAPLPTLLNALKDDDLEVRGAASQSIRNFVEARLEQWRPLLTQSPAPVLRSWVARHEDLYGTQNLNLESVLSNRNEAARTTDLFNVLGGRAAVRETLQLQLIGDAGPGRSGIRDIPASKLSGVTVKSHPFGRMLRDARGTEQSLPLANLVPPDHFFVYFSAISELQRFLDGGADFLVRLGPVFSAASVEYELKTRYLGRLGLREEDLSRFEETGAVQEIGLVLPDLFLIDGTEVTVLMRINSLELLKPALERAGVDAPEGERIVVRELSSGRRAYWTVRGDFLLASTSLAELDKILSLHRKAGRDSLGFSPEFRYMLMQLPVQEETLAYFYFSDPFLRHLVGPGAKIGQLRRMQARAEMEMLAAGALLYKLDGHRGVPTLGKLADLGYVPAALAAGDYKLRQDLVAESEEFGPLPDMKSLVETPVERVTRQEADAYGRYVRNYSSFWRQFFDPIAMRWDDTGEGTLELTTLILPLLDSDIYNQVTEFIATEEAGSPLLIPKPQPEPVFLLSVNLSDSQRIKLTESLTGALIRFTSVSPAIFDSFGSTIHFAIQDSKPIVALGSGDILGAFSESFTTRVSETLLPALLSVLTRPSKLLVELKDPDRVLDFLRQAGQQRSLEGGQGELYQVDGQDAWIYKLSLFGMLHLHLGVAIENGYLVVTNVPWSQETTVEGVSSAPLNGARLQLNLASVSEQLPALHLAAFSDYRSTAIEGMGYLYPLLTSGIASTVAEAGEIHLKLFGFRPVHPGSGGWIWQEGELKSSVFGSAVQPVQPAYRSGEQGFGLFQKIEVLSVNMQLEDTGLRARVRWKVAGEEQFRNQK